MFPPNLPHGCAAVISASHPHLEISSRSSAVRSSSGRGVESYERESLSRDGPAEIGGRRYKRASRLIEGVEEGMSTWR
jgi:hypothetical protein